MRLTLLLALCLLGASPPDLPAQLPVPELAPWSHLMWGQGIGLAGMTAIKNGAHTELVVGASAEQYGNRYWLVSRYDPTANALQRVWCSPIYSFNGAITFLTTGAILGPKVAQVLVACNDGRFEVWDLATRTRLLQVQTVAASIRGMAAVDRLGNGVHEFLVSESGKVHLYDRKGVRKYTWTGMGGSIRVGNVDTDAWPEFVTESGHVVDLKSFQKQWTKGSKFASPFHLGDIDADGRDELTCYSNSAAVQAYDLDLQRQKWTAPVSINVSLAAELADIDQDGNLEFLVASTGNGGIACLDTKTQKQEWVLQTPQPGICAVLAVDLFGDNNHELVWGSGWWSSKPDQIVVADGKTRAIHWQSRHLDPPFSPLRRGDIDGDGKPEFVSLSRYSDDGWKAGCIEVLDGTTMTRRAISPPIAVNAPSSYKPQVRLVQADSDRALEIVTKADGVQVWDFSTTQGFTRLWNVPLPVGAVAEAMHAEDVDGRPGLEILVGATRRLFMFDFATKKEIAHSFTLSRELEEIRAWDIDSDGKLEIVVRTYDGVIYVFDAATLQIEAILQPTAPTEYKTISIFRLAPKLAFLVTTNDKGHLILHYASSQGRYQALPAIPTAYQGAYGSFHILDGNLITVQSAAGRVHISLGLSPIWRSASYTLGVTRNYFGSEFLLGTHAGKTRLITNTYFGPIGFDF